MARVRSPWASLVPERVARLIARAAGARHLAVGHRLEAVSLRAAARLDVGRLAVARWLAPRHGRRLALGAQPLARRNGAEWRAEAEEMVRVFAARPVAQEHLVAGRPHGDRAAAAHLAVGLGCCSRVGCVHTTSPVLHQPHLRRGGGRVRHTRNGVEVVRPPRPASSRRGGAKSKRTRVVQPYDLPTPTSRRHRCIQHRLLDEGKGQWSDGAVAAPPRPLACQPRRGGAP
eukprot:scaffold18764_cov53-Phaeocystis_antarctica.AAC.2